MSRHSKNNTALAFFTNAELEKLDYGVIKTRLGRDSLRNYDSCFLCLQSAKNPMCCLKGHLCCKECIYENILAQRKNNARKASEYEMHLRKLEEEEQRKSELKRIKELEHIERLQTGINTEYSNPNKEVTDRSHLNSVHSNSSDVKLPSFWVPGLTPDSGYDAIKAPDNKVYCTAEKKLHEISVKSLIPVKFSKDEHSSDYIHPYMCPSCLRPFNNGSKIIVLRSCSHTICGDCYSKFVKPTSKCYTCEKSAKRRHAIKLYIEGTGFSKLGNVQAKKEILAFL